MNKPRKKLHKSLVALLVFALTLLLSNNIFAANAKGDPAVGEKVFKANCTSCHSVGNGIVVGPDLAGVTTRVPQPYADWMHKWIKNNKAVIASNDAYATKLYADNAKRDMTVFDGVLSDAQIDDVIAYLANPPKQAATAASANDGSDIFGPKKAAEKSDAWWILLIIIAVLLIIITVLRTVRKSLQSVVNEKKGLEAPADRNQWGDIVHWIKTHKMAVAFINLLITAILCVYGWQYLWGIDVTPGYHPSQPIQFSHHVHAGVNGINCIYCHSGAEKGKVAGIPTLNVCMNCHKGIKGSNPIYQKEISKIYYAVGWDPAKAAYTNPTHPVVWNRVHSLPDFVYFNHSQHVVVGKIQCQHCHGDVASFTTDQQFAPLTMGWCIDCHRATPVHMQGNGYYAKIHQALEKNFPGKEITEEDMGGTECAKCHY